MTIFLEDTLPDIRQDGLNTAKATALSGTVAITGTSLAITPAITQSGTSGNNRFTVAQIEGRQASAIPATATATAAQVATGYITSTSAAAVTITLPTGTLLGAALSAKAGDLFNLVIDNTAGANTVTIAVAVNGILSAAAAAGSGAGAGLLTVPSGVTGIAVFNLMFSSATAYAFSRAA